jgi:translation initiation factor 5B
MTDPQSITTQNPTDSKSPIFCVLGHVDSGKTSLIDYIRKTDVQSKEPGGITQKTSATFIPLPQNKKQTIPGLLMIDTPGHEVFSNMRVQGATICDFAIVVVDVFKGVEKQTIESLQILKRNKVPFIIAANKIDRINDWKTNKKTGFKSILKKQSKKAQNHVLTLTNQLKLSLAEQGFNTELYHKNKNTKEYVSIVPVSAVTGECVDDLFMVIIKLIKTFLKKKITYSDNTECMILNTSHTKQLGYYIDAILINGTLKLNDKIMFHTFNGVTTSNVRSLIVKNEYVDFIKAANVAKILVNDIKEAIPGSPLYVTNTDVDKYEKSINKQFDYIKSSMDSVGVHIHTKTLGALYALIKLLKHEKIPMASYSVGNLQKKDVLICAKMIERNDRFAVMLVFDDIASKELLELMGQHKIKLITSNIIYKLIELFQKYEQDYINLKFDKNEVIWPCQLEIKPDCIFNKKSPIILGVVIKEGTLYVGIDLVTDSKIRIGKVVGIHKNKKAVNKALKGETVTIRIDSDKTYERNFDFKNKLYSILTRRSIDTLKENHKQELISNKKLLGLIVEIKKLLNIT